VFTARYALSPYIKQICFVFKGLTNMQYIVVVHNVRNSGRERELLVCLKRGKINFLSNVPPITEKDFLCLKIPTRRPLVLQVTVFLRWWTWAWNIGETSWQRRTELLGQETFPAELPTVYLTGIGRGSNLWLRGKKSVIKCLSHVRNYSLTDCTSHSKHTYVRKGTAAVTNTCRSHVC
jgi:hypothetical protein